MSKKLLSPEDLESQMALELPDRGMLQLINVVLLSGNVISVPIAVAAALCGVQAQVLAVLAAQQQEVTCEAFAGEQGITVGNGD